MSKHGWIGVDLDGTLAHYEGWKGGAIGAPVPLMLAKVKKMLALGLEVRVFTARVSDPDRREQARVVAAIDAWCSEHIGQTLKVTNVKDFSMVRLYDDRCVQVEPNTGRCVGGDEFDAAPDQAYNSEDAPHGSPSTGEESRAGSDRAGEGAVPVRRRGGQG